MFVATFDRRRAGSDVERILAPGVLAPDACEEFAFRVERILFASHIEVRPTNDAGPLRGGSDPEMVAWICLVDADLERWQAVTALLDALPPALYATARQLRPCGRHALRRAHRWHS